jgi:putative ABC transport system permease protein
MILKYATKNFMKRPFLILIKIMGLSLSLTGFLLIVLFLKNELSYENFNKNSKRTYRFTLDYLASANARHYAWVSNTDYISKMIRYFPEIEEYVRLIPVGGVVKKEDGELIIIKQAFASDSTFFKVFAVDLPVGNRKDILNEPGSAVITESFSDKVFGKTDPIGKILTIQSRGDNNYSTAYIIKGVMKDFPQNSHLHPEFIVNPVNKSGFRGWAWTYLLLSENSSPQRIISGFKEFFAAHYNLKGKPEEIKIEAYLQKISDIHLHSSKPYEIESNSNIYVIYTLGIAALVLLVTGLFNYANLKIGMAGFNEKFLFISRISGASSHVLKYYIAEGIFIILASLIITGLLLLFADILIQKYFNMNLFSGNSFFISVILILFSILVIIIGVLPLIKQGTNYIRTSLQVTNNILNERAGLSKSIIIIQYAILIVLIIGVFVIHRQTSFSLKSGMSLKGDNLICIRNVHSNAQERFEVFKEELLKLNSVELVTGMFVPPGGVAKEIFQFSMEGYVPDPEDRSDSYIGFLTCDYSFAGIFGLDFLRGRDFSKKNNDNEGSGEYIINETAMKRFNYTDSDDIVGKEFKLIPNYYEVKIPQGKIIGVVRDFHLSGTEEKDEPLVLFKSNGIMLNNFVVSYRQGMQAEVLSSIKGIWEKMFPGYPFQYEYVSLMYKNIYKSEILQSVLLSIFTLISLFICSIGFLGMTLLSTQKRTKEIGLRKINGASTKELMVMLIWDHVKLIMIAFIIAVPVAVISLNKWLENFAYRIDLKWWIFIMAILIVILTALMTISMQSWKVASHNPIDALRYE